MVEARTFKIVEVNGKKVSDDGRYHGSSPLQAAKKAFNQYCRKNNIKICKKDLVIEETTRGGKSKQYSYRAERKKLRKPKEVTRGDTTYEIEYESIVKKA